MEIEGYPNYLVYEDGRVFSKKNQQMLKHQRVKGYHYVRLWENNKDKLIRVHRLVGIHYIPNPENKKDVDHIDRNKSNNHVSNLRWATRSENMQNMDVLKNNKLGIKNISYMKTRKRYRFQKQIRGKNHYKYFKTLEEAIDYKKDYEENLTH